jgi:maintenance of morphology protein 1
LSISVVRFSGTLCISLVPASTPPLHTPSPMPSPPMAETRGPTTGAQAADAQASDQARSSPKSNVAFSFLPDYRLDLSVRSLIGSRSRLQDVPKVAQLVEARVHAWFEERVVEPRVQVVGLPDLWPRMGRTGVRTGDDSETGSNTASRSAMSVDMGGPLRGDDSDRDPEALRFRGLGPRPPIPFDAISRTSSYQVETGGARSPSLTRERSLGDDFHMPGAMPEVLGP